MEIGLTYATKTKHSKKIAESIADELKIEAKNISTHPTYNNVDLLFLAGGIYGGESLPEMIDFAKKLTPQQARNVILLTSCVSKKANQETVRKHLTANGINVLDEFMCQGNFLFVGVGHPDQKDIADAVTFAKEAVKNYQLTSTI